MALVTSSSSAFITGATAAIADPPQIDVPTPTRIVVFLESFRVLPASQAIGKTAVNVNSITTREVRPAFMTLYRFMSKPRSIIEYCRSFFDVNFKPSVNFIFPPICSFIKPGKNRDINIPPAIAAIGPPNRGNDFPKNQAGTAMRKHRIIPGSLFMMISPFYDLYKSSVNYILIIKYYNSYYHNQS